MNIDSSSFRTRLLLGAIAVLMLVSVLVYFVSQNVSLKNWAGGGMLLALVLFFAHWVVPEFDDSVHGQIQRLLRKKGAKGDLADFSATCFDIYEKCETVYHKSGNHAGTWGSETFAVWGYELGLQTLSVPNNHRLDTAICAAIDASGGAIPTHIVVAYWIRDDPLLEGNFFSPETKGYRIYSISQLQYDQLASGYRQRNSVLV